MPSSPNGIASISSVHHVTPAKTVCMILYRLSALVDEWLARPVPCDINSRPWLPELKENKDEIVNDDAETEEFTCPNATAIVSLQSINQGVTLHPSPHTSSAPTAFGMIAIELFFANGACDAIIHPLRASCNIGPRIHHFDLVVEAFGMDFARAERIYRSAGGSHEVVLLRLCKRGHVWWQNLRNAAYTSGHDVQATARSLDDDGAKRFGQTGIEKDVSTNHYVSHFFVPHWSDQFDSVLQDPSFHHLFQVDGFWSRASYQEFYFGMCGENSRQSSDQEIGTLVVEQSRYGDDGDSFVGFEPSRYRARFRVAILMASRGICQRLEVFRDHCVWNNGSNKRIKLCPKHSIFFAGMADTDDMIHVAQEEFEQFVGQYGRRICEAE